MVTDLSSVRGGGRARSVADPLRRTLLGGAGLLVGAALAWPISALAAAKVSQREAGYQPSPKGGARCTACTQFVAPASCRLVDGAISPTGWCSFFAPRPR